MYGVFVGRLQVSSRLGAAISDAVGDWYRQLKEDVVELIPAKDRVWLAVDNAYFRSDFVDYINTLGWDFSISVTDPKVKQAILNRLSQDESWTPLADDDSAQVTKRFISQPTGRVPIVV